MKNLTLIVVSLFCLEVWAQEVLRITPSGKNIRRHNQVSILFDTEMVALGKMDVDSKNLPITITPSLKCKWHWADQKNLNCELDHEDGVKLATKYTIKVDKSFKSYKGKKLKKSYTHTFETLRPKLNYFSTKSMREWSSPVKPQVSLSFNMMVTKASIERSLKFSSGSVKYSLTNSDYSKCTKDYCSQFYLNVEEPLQRGQTYSITIGKGLQTNEGPLRGKKSKKKSVSTAKIFKMSFLSCSYFDSYRGYTDSKKYYPAIGEIDASKEKVCEPHLGKYINFTNSVIPKEAYQKIKITPNPAGKSGVNPFSKNYNFDSSYGSGSLYLPGVLKSGVVYEVDFSEVKNIFNEKLSGATKVKISFARRSPTIRTKYTNAVIEHGVGNDIPVLVTNKDSFKINYEKWVSGDYKQGQTKTVKVAAPLDVSYYAPIGLKDLLDNKPGMISYSIPEIRYSRQLSAISSPYQVFLKLGHFSSLAWVLDFQTGKPVKNAKVQISTFGGKKKLGKEYETDSEGMVRLDGIQKLSPKLKELSALKGYYYYDDDTYGNSYYLTVKKKDNFAILPITNSYSTNSYYDEEAYPTMTKKYGHIKAWGLTPQGVYKAGSDIDFKIYVRNEKNKKLTMPPKDPKYDLKIMGPTGVVFKEYENIKLTKFGTYAGKLFTSQNALSGNYSFYLRIDSDYEFREIHCFDVLVADFRPAPFKAFTNINKKHFEKGDELVVTGSAKMHSGGAFGGTDSRITVLMSQIQFEPTNNKYKSFSFYDDSYFSTSQQVIDKNTEVLGDSGERVHKVLLKRSIPVGSLFIENAVKDDRGKYIASKASATYYGSDRFLGTKINKWSYRVGDDVEIDHVILNAKSKLVKKEKVTVKIQQYIVTASKVKGSGNAFITKYNSEWKEVHDCKVEIKDDDENYCEFEPKKAGYYKSISSIKNGSYNREHHFYVVGKDRFLWGDDNKDNVSLVTSTNDVKVDDKVKVLIKNPFPKAKALITVERYGVIDQWIEEIDKSAHPIEFKVKPEYIPGFYLSVNLFSPRVEKTSGFGKLDLGKPAFKTGYLKFGVNDPYKRIDVEIDTDKKKYLPREEVEIELEADARNGSLDDVEIAVAVLDEAVFDLIKGGKSYFDPYKGLTKLESLDVKSFSLIKNLIGKQKFEKKGANQGGDGGGGNATKTRGFIDYLAYWNPSVKLKGDSGTIKFKLPDNLTGWKVIAISADTKDRLGVSTAKFVTNLPTEIRAAVPNQLIEGDNFKARFTVKNRENKKRTIKVKMNAAGVVKGNEKSRTKEFEIELKPNQRKNVEFNVKVGKIKRNRKVKKASVRILVEAGDSIHTDRFVKYIDVAKKRPSQVVAQYGEILKEETKKIDIKFPKDIFEDVGGLEISGSTTLLGHLEDGFKYMRDYPYGCWEQRLSKATAAAQYIKLKSYVGKKVTWEKPQDIVHRAIKDAASFQMSNGAMSYYGRYESKYLSAFTGIAFSWLEDYGYEVDKTVKKKLIEYLKSMLKTNDYPKYFSGSSRNSLRAIALAALSEFGEATTSDLERLWPKFNNMSKFAQFNFYQSAINIEKKPNVSSKALTQLLNSVVVDSGKVRFNESFHDSYYYFHYSSKRTQCMGLLTTTNAVKKDVEAKKVSDLPTKLVRTITSDMQLKKVFWDSTQSTLYCLNSLINFASHYEKDEPNLTMNVKFKEKSLGKQKFKERSLKAKSLNYELEKGDIDKVLPLEISKKGKGTLYYKTTMSYSFLKDQGKLNHGIDLKKHVAVKRNDKWVDVDDKMILKRGELLRVDLFVSVPTGRHYVVVDDPIPGGLEAVNTQFANASTVDDQDGAYAKSLISKFYNNGRFFWYDSSRYSFYHQELKHDRALFYSTYLPPGKYYVGYKAQVIATGKFTSMPAVAKEMYFPETYGTTVNRVLTIEE